MDEMRQRKIQACNGTVDRKKSPKLADELLAAQMETARAALEQVVADFRAGRPVAFIVQTAALPSMDEPPGTEVPGALVQLGYRPLIDMMITRLVAENIESMLGLPAKEGADGRTAG